MGTALDLEEQVGKVLVDNFLVVLLLNTEVVLNEIYNIKV